MLTMAVLCKFAVQRSKVQNLHSLYQFAVAGLVCEEEYKSRSPAV